MEFLKQLAAMIEREQDAAEAADKIGGAVAWSDRDCHTARAQAFLEAADLYQSVKRQGL